MVPERFGGRKLGEFKLPRVGSKREQPRRLGPPPEWRSRGRWRRTLLIALVLPPSLLAASFMLRVVPEWGGVTLIPIIATLFGALFGWLSLGFWTAAIGFVLLLRGGDRFGIAAPDEDDTPIDPAARSAIVMPICDESVERVFAGLRAIRRSLERTGELRHFDFFVLSDSPAPESWLAEERAWFEWVTTSATESEVFYRRRKARVKRKSGNVSDFCRRWGRRYRYMVVLDADSVMSGDTLVHLVRRMEHNPTVGILQTTPSVVRARSLFARISQFASRLYGPMFSTGMGFWQLGNAPYWGHNAIIRVEPFIKHCSLARLSGHPPFGGDILSHDFVEAALLGRAGYHIWLAIDLKGSWEETPESLLEELKRDRRWCQGNLQHLRLLLTEGVSSAHRALFLNGIFAYVSALLWMAFLVMASAETVLRALRPPEYFPAGPTLFPNWPVWRPEWALALIALTAILLLGPKVLAVLLTLLRGQHRGFGGRFALARSAFLELVASSLLAPIRMLFYCRFVVMQLFGFTVTWRGGAGDEGETTWMQALREHGPGTLIAIAWAGALLAFDPDGLRYVAPIAGALLLSIPTSVLLSRESLGRWSSKRGWFRVPEEIDPPRELAELAEAVPYATPHAELDAAEVLRDGVRWAVVDPRGFGTHAVFLRGSRKMNASLRARRQELVARALAGGPNALAAPEWGQLLSDPDSTRELHRAVWRLPEGPAAEAWGF
jgi:membrane glycosyltransferase